MSLIQLLDPVCLKHGYQIEDIAWSSGHNLMITIDRIDGCGVTVQDCSIMSEILSRTLDVEDPIKHRYTLEVSSPGLERPLRTLEQFRRHLGEDIRVRLMKPYPIVKPGQVPQYNLTGNLQAVTNEGTLTIHETRGDQVLEPCEIQIQHIERAQLVISNDKLFGGIR